MDTWICRARRLALAGAAVAVLGGCAAGGGASGTLKRTELEYSAGQPMVQPAQTTVAQVQVQGAGPQEPHVIVYFDFDRYDVKPHYTPDLEKQAQMLRANPTARAVVEGHTDQLGSVEYNLALGQRRAEAVRRALTLLGANAAQIEAVSYGETRLAAEGEDAQSRQLNRRAEIRRQP